MFQLSKRFGFSSNQYVWNIPIGRQLEFSSLSLSEWKWRPVALRHFTILRAERNIFFSTGILNFTFASFDRLPSHFNNWNNCFENFIWNVSVSGFEKIESDNIVTVLWWTKSVYCCQSDVWGIKSEALVQIPWVYVCFWNSNFYFKLSSCLSDW